MRDGLPYHWRESYVCKKGKSMKPREDCMRNSPGCWRNIAIALTDFCRGTQKSEQTAQACANA
jgi:hypothetical protein